MTSNLMKTLRGITARLSRTKEVKEITAPTRYDDTLVLYNEANVDSMLAAAMFYFIAQFGSVKSRAWHHLNNSIDLHGVKTLVCMGHELDKDLIHFCIVSTDVHLVLPMRPGAYEWLEKEKLYLAHKERFTLLKAEYEDVSELHRLTDNTFTRLVQYFVAERDFSLDLPVDLVAAIPYVLRFVTFAYPIAEFTVELNEVFPVETENAYRILIGDLTGRLLNALGQMNSKVLLQTLRMEDVNEQTRWNHQQNHQRVITRIGRSISNQKIVVDKGEGKTWHIRIVSLAEHEIHQLGLVPFDKADALVAYEDLRGYRFYRIYAKNVHDGRSIAAAINAEYVFVEGVFVTAVSAVPTVFVN